MDIQALIKKAFYIPLSKYKLWKLTFYIPLSKYKLWKMLKLPKPHTKRNRSYNIYLARGCHTFYIYIYISCDVGYREVLTKFFLYSLILLFIIYIDFIVSFST